MSKLAKDMNGQVITAKSGYSRIVTGKRTLAYANDRKATPPARLPRGLDGAPARLRKRTTIKHDRALLIVTDENMEAARALLQDVAKKAGVCSGATTNARLTRSRAI